MDHEQRFLVTAESCLGVATYAVWRRPGETVEAAFHRQHGRVMFPQTITKKERADLCDRK